MLKGIVKANPYKFFPIVSYSNGMKQIPIKWDYRTGKQIYETKEYFSSYRVVRDQEKRAMGLLGQEVEFTIIDGEAKIKNL